MARKKIVINNTKYQLYEDSLRNYDGYILITGDTVLDKKPKDHVVIGYIIDSGQKIAVCKKSYEKLAPIFIGGVSILAAGFLAGLFIFLRNATNVDVPHFTFNRDNVIESLDDGVTKEKDGLTYSEYGTYDGTNASVYVKSRHKDATLKLVFGDVESEEVPITEAYSIPINLNINVEDAISGTMIYKRGDTEIPYSIILEYANTVAPSLQMGEDVPRETTAEIKKTPDETSEGETIVNDINEYKESEADFGNFEVLNDHPDEALEKALREGRQN